MAFSFWRWLTGDRDQPASWKEVSCSELFDAAADYTMRRLAWEICVDLVASSFARCEFRTYVKGEETRGAEYWLWNIQPNVNQTSTEFLRKFVDRLYRNGEALIVDVRRREGGLSSLAVADDFDVDDGDSATRQAVYRRVKVGDTTLNKSFRGSDALYVRLNTEKIRPVLDQMTASWSKMATLAKNAAEWDGGQHWKVHVDQIASGQQDFEANFAAMIAQQVKPFFEGGNTVLPEFSGYSYERIGGNSSASGRTTRDIRAMVDDILDFTAEALLIPPVLVHGAVEAIGDANNRFLTWVIDPICDALQEAIVSQRYGLEAWEEGTYLRIDSSAILHYDLFGQAASIEKLIGSGVYTINDIRRSAGQAPIKEPWADQHWMTRNIGSVQEVAAALSAQEGGNA